MNIIGYIGHKSVESLLFVEEREYINKIDPLFGKIGKVIDYFFIVHSTLLF